MNIREFLQKKGINVETRKCLRWSNVDVCFISSEGVEDEVQFTIESALTKKGKEELIELYEDFCRENSLKSNTVTGIHLVQTAFTMEELIAVEC